MSTIIQFRRGTAAEWTSVNPTLAEGEKGYETDSIGTEEALSKIGDGVNDWVNLPYQVSGKVKSVNGKEGDVILDGTEIPLLPGTTTPTVTGSIADLDNSVTLLETNKLDATATAVQTTRPLKTLNSKSLEGTGNENLFGTDIETSDGSGITVNGAIVDIQGEVVILQTENIVQQLAIDLNTAKVSDINHVTLELPNVDNTSDVNKPISNDTQTALNLKADQSDLTLTNSQVLNNTTALDLKVAIATNPSKTVKGAIKAFYDVSTSTLEISIDGVDIP